MPYTKIAQAEMLSPACCRMCQAVDKREWFIDLGYSEDFWGAVYYCNYCFDEVAGVAGYMLKSTLDEYREDYQRMVELIKENQWEMQGAVDILQFGGFDVLALYSWIRAVATGKVVVEFPERKEPVGPGKNRSTEPSDSERSTDTGILEFNV